MSSIKKYIENFLWSTCYPLFQKVAINEKKILFETDLAMYCGNQKQIYEELIRDEMFLNYEFIWVLKPKQIVPGNAKRVRKVGIRYLYHLATAKYIFTDGALPDKFKKNEQQVWINCAIEKYQFKASETDEKADDITKYLEQYDYIISQTDAHTKLIGNKVHEKTKIIQSGYPRVNELLQINNYQLEKIKEKYGLVATDKILVCLQGNNSEGLDFDFENVIKRSSGWKIVVVNSFQTQNNNSKRLIELENTADLTQLLILSDILLTSSISVAIDYAFTNKPIIFKSLDQKELNVINEMMPKKLPGKIIKSEQELIKILKNKTNYQKQHLKLLNEFQAEFCKSDVKNATQKIVSRVIRRSNEKTKDEVEDTL